MIDKTLQERELTLVRLESAKPELCFSSGTNGATYTRDEMIEHVREGDAVGKDFVDVQMEFMRALKGGGLAKLIASV